MPKTLYRYGKKPKLEEREEKNNKVETIETAKQPMQKRINKNGEISKKGKTSKYPGVSGKPDGTWYIRKYINGKEYYIASFKSEKKAGEVSLRLDKVFHNAKIKKGKGLY